MERRVVARPIRVVEGPITVPDGPVPPDGGDAPDAQADTTPTPATAAPRRTVPRRWLIVGTVVVLAPLAVYAIALFAERGTVPRGTTVAGVDIGGLDSAEAAAVLQEEVVPRTTRPLTLAAADARQRVDVRAAGVRLDVAATVERARSERDPLAVIGGLFGAAGSVEPVVVVDDDALARATRSTAARLDRAAVDGGLEFSGERVVVVAPRPGRAVDAAAISAAIVANAASAERTVELPVTVTSPGLTRDQVQEAARTLGAAVVSGPVVVRVTGAARESVTVPVRRLTPHLGTRVEDGSVVLTVDAAGLAKALRADLGPLEQPAKDATFRIVSGRPQVVPAVAGRVVDREELVEAVRDAVSSRTDRVADVALTTQQPDLTTQEARELGVVERLSTFRQPFPFAPYRFQNIGEAARRINGTLLLPGETFSMNDTVKKRTPENGYTTGFVIKDGRLTEDLGGGVSTITTAMWHAAFFAGLERVEQRAHSFYISRYLPGLEATVAWGSLDLKFRNDSPNGVFITAVRARNGVTVTMYGTKRYDIDADFGPRTNVRPFRSVTDTSSTCTPQAGVDGFRIVVTRVFKQNGEVVRREPLTTTYRPAEKITCRAPAPRPTPTPTTTPRPTRAPGG